MSGPAEMTLRLACAADANLQHEIEQFLYYEAAVLDDRRYLEWLDLLSDDCRYYMPTRYNRARREADREFSRADEAAHFDDDKASLRIRVKRLLTGQAWAEDPPSRTRHMVFNVRVARLGADEVRVLSNFYVYRSRLERDVDAFVGRRDDRLRRCRGPHGWQIARRELYLDQTVVLAKNISIFL